LIDYDQETPLEEILHRTFTIDMEIFGEKVTEELKPNGNNIYVTKDNR